MRIKDLLLTNNEKAINQVVFFTASAGVVNAAGTNNVITGITYPAIMEVGNLLLLVCTNRTRLNGPAAPPAGWSVYQTWNPNPSNNYIAVFSRVVDGTESGTFSVTYTSSDAQAKQAQIYQFKNCEVPPEGVIGTPYALTLAIPGSLTCTRDKSLAVSLIMSNNASPGSTYGLPWVNAGGIVTGVNNGSSIVLNVAPMPVIGTTLSGGSYNSVNNIVLSFILNPKYV